MLSRSLALGGQASRGFAPVESPFGSVMFVVFGGNLLVNPVSYKKTTQRVCACVFLVLGNLKMLVGFEKKPKKTQDLGVPPV